VVDELREAAKREIRRRVWASNRGKATRKYIREHPELREQFERTGTISVGKDLPEFVTEASVLLELSLRARRREITKAVRKWKEEHPGEVAKMRKALEVSSGD